MSQLDPVIQQNKPYEYGYNAITYLDDSYKTGMNFGVLKLKKGEKHSLTSPLESAFLLMTGKIVFHYAKGKEYQAFRTSYFDQNPYVLHISAHEAAEVEALTDCEIMVMQTQNTQNFTPMVFDGGNMLESERRGKGLLQDASYRIVRTVFDKRNRPESNLVVGEIITFSGHWSSCPPHFHKQPEIYHYRFSEPQGFGFGEDGQAVKRIKHNDTMVILDEKEHAHTTAPGYALYTLWFIRHLKDDPYITPTFKEEHEWARTENANMRVWIPVEDILL
ncbi:5-deoxy-glucuronate isomerase [Facilibium subflavum]|uniref:5-deoxy-glucuronate isomerase n=1 Tax=Facilibium subflavum TaxID=2219058 RepID=UPI000E655267|nr:5-deoxy-glucuronate isomerase [Facilibium subflavum]